MTASARDLLASLVSAVATKGIRVVDLTQTLSEETPVLVLPPQFGQCAPFSREVISRYDERGVAWYWSNFTVGEHTGTHFDAPAHWISGKDLPNNSLDRLAADDFVAAAVVLDFVSQAAADPDFILEPQDILAWESRHGRVPPRNWVLFRTDWSKRNGEAYTNRRDDGPHTPGPSAAAIRFLIEERDVLGFGVETIGTDAGQAYRFEPAYPAHSFLHGAGRYGLQCLENLDLLPPTGAVLIAAPLKIKDGSGSPLRVLALVAG